MSKDFRYEIDEYKIILSYRNLVKGSQNRHLHESYEILYVASGKRFMFIDGNKFEMKKGEIIIIPPNTIHKSFNNNQGSEIYNIYCTPDMEIDLKKTIINNSKNLINLINKIFIELKNRQPNYKYMISSLSNQILILCNRENSLQISNKSKNSTINSIIDYINTNFEKAITLDSLSRRYNLTPEYISRFFPHNTGFNVTEYIHYVRIQNAKKLLIDNSHTITQICFLCGFGSITNFGRVFKSITGYSPSKFKQQS